MANMREIRERISSIQQILKITNAMYLMSSSKLKKARKSLESTMPYFTTLQDTIEDILEHTPHIRQTYFDRRTHIKEDDRKKGFVIITADKGLCGSYNHNVLKLAEQELKKAFVNNCYIFVLGEVGRHYFMRRNNDIDHSEIVLDKFEKRELDEVYVIYTEMKGNEYEPKVVRLLPFERKHFGVDKDGTTKKLPKASFLPSPEKVMKYLIPNYAKGLIYGAMVEAFCCEQQARMTAMDAATNSAKDMIKDLSLSFNRARQAAITQEISEVAGGANALDNMSANG